jgi:DNA invertase Pin-like site-specific DNA recombinase
MTSAIGYIRVSTDEQFENGGGLDGQRKAIVDECASRGWELLRIETEDAGASGKEIDRPGLNRARDAMDAGEADVLIVAKLDRLSRNTVQGLAFIEAAGKTGRGKRKRAWSVVACDGMGDTTTSAGELMTAVQFSFAQYERREIARRTRVGMAAKRAAGTLQGPIGRPRDLPKDVVSRIVAMRAKGLSYGKIAKALNDAEVPTAHGGRAWYPMTVSKVLASEATEYPSRRPERDG